MNLKHYLSNKGSVKPKLVESLCRAITEMVKGGINHHKDDPNFMAEYKSGRSKVRKRDKLDLPDLSNLPGWRNR